MPFDTLWLALDKSVRRYDEDGRLHVAVSHLTKAAVNPYRGSEIPGWQELGLDPDRIYNLLRDPGELEKAVPTFNNIQLLDQHIPVTAADAQQPRVVGSTGTNATWNPPYIDNSLVFWTDAAKAMIETGAQRELSAAYRYDPVMTPGTYLGKSYDGVMKNIRANHVALVEAGRAGSDVVVMDSKLEEMPMPTLALSRRATYTAGSLAAYIKPLLAKDQKLPDLPALLAGLTAKNWDKQKPVIAAKITDLLKGKLATDAEIHIHEHMDGAGAEAPGDDTPLAVEGAASEGSEVDPAEGADPDAGAGDDDLANKVQQLLQGKIDDNDLAIILQAIAATKKPAEEDPAAAAAAAGPPNGEATDNAADLPKPGLAKGPAMDAKMVDARIKKAIAETRESERRVRDAEKFVFKYVGNVVAMDSAEAVYKFALEAMGEQNIADLHPSAYRAVLSRIPVPGSEQARPSHLAMDASGNKSYLERFPNANRLQARH
jgi:hypothetical protein